MYSQEHTVQLPNYPELGTPTQGVSSGSGTDGQTSVSGLADVAMAGQTALVSTSGTGPTPAHGQGDTMLVTSPDSQPPT